MTARRKRRTVTHIMEDRSYEVIKNALPPHWVIRPFNQPDYGIDIVIEIFNPVNEKEGTFETIGEYLYVQVKSVQQIKAVKKRLYTVQNVAKGQWIENKKDYVDGQVVKYKIDTNILFTVEEMGSSICVLLFLVDLSNGKIYFSCLNDLIDKIIRPKYPHYAAQNTITIQIPAFAEIGNREVSDLALSLYGERAKLLAAFAKFYYQRNEIINYLGVKDLPVVTLRDSLQNNLIFDMTVFSKMIRHFISQIEYLDIWQVSMTGSIKVTRKLLDDLKDLLSVSDADEKELINQVVLTWHSLCNLSNIYEEIIRECFLKAFSYKLLGQNLF